MAAALSAWLWMNDCDIAKPPTDESVEIVKNCSAISAAYHFANSELVLNIKYASSGAAYIIDMSKWNEFVHNLTAAIPDMINLAELEYMAYQSHMPPRGTLLSLIQELACPLRGVAFHTNFVLDVIPQIILNTISSLHIRYLITVEDLISDALPLTSIAQLEIIQGVLRMDWANFKKFAGKFRNTSFIRAGRAIDLKFDVEPPESVAELQEEYGTDSWESIVEQYYGNQQLMVKYAGKMS